jgi:2-oxoglutarate dehydrogenase E2 component (dihydrolipoamide succinyltransferase)
MFLSHSYDHRVVDGALEEEFVKRVAEYLEAFDVIETFKKMIALKPNRF